MSPVPLSKAQNTRIRGQELTCPLNICLFFFEKPFDLRHHFFVVNLLRISGCGSLSGNGRVWLSSKVRKKHGQRTEQGQIRAEMIDEFYAVLIRKLAKHCSADSTHAESKTEEET